MKRILLTGATGCVGSHALPLLMAQGWEVHAVSSREQPARSGVIWHHIDLLDLRGIEGLVRQAGASHLLHLAWYVAPGRWAMAPENLDWVQASLELLRRFQQHGGRRVVVAGSCLEYDWSYGYCSEERTPRTPHTLYGVCKNALQLLTAALSSTEMTSVWPRLFNLYGPHEHPDRLVASVIRSLLHDQPARCSHGRQIRDYLFSHDAAEALVELLDSEIAGPINIASGEPIPLRDLVLRIGTLLGKSDLLRFGEVPPASTDVPLVAADITRARQLFGWRPRFDLETGLAHTIAWWREHE